MKKIIKIIFIIGVAIFGLAWVLSSIFTMMTFSDQFEIHEAEHLVYQEVPSIDCSAIGYDHKDLKIQFSYRYPLVNFNGKLEVIDKQDTINNSEGRLLYSGPYYDQIILGNLCYSNKNKESLHKNLEFVFSDKDAAYWFYSDVGKKGYPFLKHNTVEIKIDWFSIHPSRPYRIKPVD